MHRDTAIGIWETGTVAARTFEYRVTIEGEEVMKRRLTPMETMQVRDMSAQYRSLFSSSASSKKGIKSYLQLMGDSLFRLFLQAGWQDLGPKILSGGRLVVASSIPQVLQLPWELLRLPGVEPLIVGLSDRFSILRLPKEVSIQSALSTFLPSFYPELKAGPLRLLFFSADPHSFEEEELSLIQALEGVDIQLKIAESATIEELQRLAEEFCPHLVYLSGEGSISVGASGGVSGEEALFALYDPAGKPDMISADRLAAALKNGKPECIVLGSAKKRPDPAIDLLCHRLSQIIPLAVAWNGPISSSKEFFRYLSSGGSLDEAVGGAARRILESLNEAEEAQMEAYPVLYATRKPSGLFDPVKNREEKAIDYQELPAFPGMTEGYAEEFVDRRKDLQRLYQAIGQGASNTMIITGPESWGKSTLANNLARSSAALGYFVLPLAGTPHNPITSARLLESAGSQLSAKREYGETAELKNLKNPGLSVQERLSALMDILKSNKILLLWDALSLDENTGRISDPHLGRFYQQMLRGLGLSRAIITVPNSPNDVAILPSSALNWRIENLSLAAFIRFVLQDGLISGRYHRGEISFDDLVSLYSLYKKDPAQLNLMRSSLKRGVPKGMPSEEDHLAVLTGALSPESLAALRRSAVYDIAMNQAGFAAAANTSEERAAENLSAWEDLSLAYKLGDLWAIPSSARSSLLAGLSLEEQREAQKSAAEFLRATGESGRCQELYLSRLDCLQEARGHYIQAGAIADAERVTARISGYLERRGYYSEVIRLNRELVELHPNAETMNWIARAYLDQSDLDSAAEWYKRALQISSNAISHQGLGMALLAQKRHDQAEENLQKALEGFLADGNKEGEAESLHALASIDMAKNDSAMALDKLEKASQIREGLGDRLGEAATLQEMAGLDIMKKDYESARPRLQKALKLLKESADRRGEAVLLFSLASIDQEIGDLEQAEKELGEALAITRYLADSKGTAASLHSLGMVFSQKGEKEKAAEHFREALEIYQQLKDQPGEAGAFFQLGALAVQKDRIQEGLCLMALSAVVLRSTKSDEVKNIEPVVERLASQLGYSQEQFMAMLQEVMHSYVKDKGMGLVERAFRE